MQVSNPAALTNLTTTEINESGLERASPCGVQVPPVVVILLSHLMFCQYCNVLIPKERRELQLTSCLTCAEKYTTPLKGDMNYAHKTAPTLMLMSSETHANYRRYVPYGKYTGRGSGTHRMSRPITSLK
jgi:hypothetical protein